MIIGKKKTTLQCLIRTNCLKIYDLEFRYTFERYIDICQNVYFISIPKVCKHTGDYRKLVLVHLLCSAQKPTITNLFVDYLAVTTRYLFTYEINIEYLYYFI